MHSGRIKNVTINVIVGLSCQMINAVLAFVVRFFFIDSLGIEYLGVNGLFNDILQFLSLLELGVGTSIIYRLYAPLKSKDCKKLSAWMTIYQKAYIIIGLTILILGISLTPIMPWLIKGQTQISENLYIIYILFVINSSASYFFAYKQSLIIADQKSYIVTIIRQVVKLIQSICQILILLYLKDFIAYLCVGILFTLFTNICINLRANKLYPFLSRNNSDHIPTTEKKALFSDIKSLLFYKLGYILLNNSNYIIISLILGITYVGLGSNYFLITAAIEIIIIQLINALTASVGNFNVEATPARRWNLFAQLNIIGVGLCGLIYSAAYIFSEEFITLWIGDSYILGNLEVSSIILFMFIKNSGSFSYMFRTTQGAFKQVKFVPAIVSLFHIPLAFVLVKLIGFAGIYISASCSILIINLYDGKIICKTCSLRFYKYILLNAFITLSISLSSYSGYSLSTALINSDDQWQTLIIRLLIYSSAYITLWGCICYSFSSSIKTLVHRSFHK